MGPTQIEALSISYAHICALCFIPSSSPSIDLPGKGDLIAFDAEFVSVQHEDHYLTATGSKMVLREGRSALARMSIIDCRTGRVIIDDHVLPREPVVDYLTRFSGIIEEHLDINKSPHHLITTRNAYLKLRLLLERYVSYAQFCTPLSSISPYIFGTHQQVYLPLYCLKLFSLFHCFYKTVVAYSSAMACAKTLPR